MLKRLLGDSVSIVFGNLETVFKVCGAWFVLQVLMVMLLVFVSGDAGETSASFGIGLYVIVFLVFTMVSSASISVAWHRFGLLGERPDAIHLKLGPTEFRFISKSLLLFLILVMCMFFVMLVHMVIGVIPVTGVVVALLAIFAIPTFLRLSLILPATAVERPIGLGEAYEAGKGLGWWMFLAIFLLTVPFTLLNEALGYILDITTGGLPVFLIQIKVMILNVLLQIIITVLSISVITAAYRIAIEWQSGNMQG
ncbi:MAG: hypothetical protein ABJY83_12800 [Roseibium sp.]